MAKLSDIFIDDTTGNLSHTKIWTHIAYATATVVFLRQPDTPIEIWLVYLGIVGGQNVLNKWITMKYGQVDNGTTNGSNTGKSLAVDGTIDISVK